MADVSTGGVLCTGSGTGTTGAVTVSAVQEGYLSPTVSVGEKFYYVIKNDNGNNIEYGVGTWTASSPGIGVFTRSVIKSTNGAATALNLSGNSFNVYIDIPAEKIVFVLDDGTVKNADAIIKSISVDDFAALAALATPTNNNVLYMVKQGTSLNDGRGGLFEWVAGDTSTQDDHTTDVTVNIIKLTGASTGRMFRRKFFLDVFEASASTNQPLGTIGTIGSGDAKSLEIKRSINSTETNKKIPEVESYHQGEYATFAAWKAVASTKWKASDTFVFRGITSENDLGGQRLTYKWDASSTDTASLNSITIRPDDVSGSNPGRAVLVEPSAMPKFSNADATPSMALSRFQRCADTVPAAITALDDMVDLQPYYIFPGAQDQVFTHGASLKCPAGVDYTLRTDGSPLLAISDNGVVYLLTGGGGVAGVSDTNYHATAAQLATAAHAINTSRKMLGSFALDTTNNRLYMALGALATSKWRPLDDQSGLSDVTPS